MDSGLKQQRYAVTGANGLVGKALVHSLANDGHHVRTVFRSTVPDSFQDQHLIEVCRGDVTDLNFLLEAFDQVDGVFHVAAFARPWAKDPSVYYAINQMGTRNVCEAALKCRVRRVVYTSSAGTHGAQQGDRLIHEEQWPPHYFTDYEQSKYNGWQEALSFLDKGLEVCGVSPARVYAPGDASESNVPVRMVEMYLKRGFGLVPLSGQGIGSYVFIDDVVQGHRLAMEKGTPGEEYLLGGVNASYNAFFDVVRSISGKQRPVINVPYPLSLAIGKTQLFAAEVLGIKPMITTPWVRKYLKDWGVSSAKIEQLGYRITPLEHGIDAVIRGLSSS